MQAIRAKLNSRRGASLLLALLVFLICAMAGTGALTAASANIGRYRYAEEEEQCYLAVSSAARLVAEALQRSEYTAIYQKTVTITTEYPGGYANEDTKYQEEPPIWDSPLKKLLETDLRQLFHSEWYVPEIGLSPMPDGHSAVTFQLEGLPDVTAELQLGEAGKLTGTFWVARADGTRLCATTLEVDSAGWEEESTELFSSFDDDNLETGPEGPSGFTVKTVITEHRCRLKWTAARFGRPEGGNPP